MICGVETKPCNLGFEYIEFTGEKVRIRPTTYDDAKQGFKLIHNNRAILKWLCWSGPKDKNDLAETYGVRWPQEIKAGTKYSFAIEEKSNPGVFIGSADARVFRHPQQFQVGYWLGVPYWHKGYTPEALALICHFCFKHLGAKVITSSAFVGNLASRRVMEKNGFQFEGTLRRQICKDGDWIDLWHLSLLVEEWEKRDFRPWSEKLVPYLKGTK
jgi:ribosomal-protein-alanine N-acetyltransferase